MADPSDVPSPGPGKNWFGRKTSPEVEATMARVRSKRGLTPGGIVGVAIVVTYVVVALTGAVGTIDGILTPLWVTSLFVIYALWRGVQVLEEIRDRRTEQ